MERRRQGADVSASERGGLPQHRRGVERERGLRPAAARSALGWRSGRRERERLPRERGQSAAGACCARCLTQPGKPWAASEAVAGTATARKRATDARVRRAPQAAPPGQRQRWRGNIGCVGRSQIRTRALLRRAGAHRCGRAGCLARREAEPWESLPAGRARAVSRPSRAWASGPETSGCLRALAAAETLSLVARAAAPTARQLRRQSLER